MSTTTTTLHTTPTTSQTRPRVWLVAGLGTHQEPTDLPVVRDDRCHCWTRGADGRWHTADNRHHATWTELHNRTDLVEVIALSDRDLGDWDGTENTPAGSVAA